MGNTGERRAAQESNDRQRLRPRRQRPRWRATRATGDFDLRTFSIRAYPVDKVPELRPGMTVSGDRFRNAANRLQLWMWPLCVPAQSLRAFMSSIMRWRSGLTAARTGPSRSAVPIDREQSFRLIPITRSGIAISLWMGVNETVG